MFDVYINWDDHNDHKVVDGFAGLIELLVSTDSIKSGEPDENIVFTARTARGRLCCICRLQRGTIDIAYLAGVSGFERELRCAGFSVVSH